MTDRIQTRWRDPDQVARQAIANIARRQRRATAITPIGSITAIRITPQAYADAARNHCPPYMLRNIALKAANALCSAGSWQINDWLYCQIDCTGAIVSVNVLGAADKSRHLN